MSKITEICGNYPDGFKKNDLENNPDYMFVKDDSYIGVSVYDAEGNSAFMNSFEECEHYVSGGWEFNSSISNEIFYENTIFVFLLVVSIGSFILKKYFKISIDD